MVGISVVVVVVVVVDVDLLHSNRPLIGIDQDAPISAPSIRRRRRQRQRLNFPPGFPPVGAPLPRCRFHFRIWDVGFFFFEL